MSGSSGSTGESRSPRKEIGLVAAISIGVGGMIGAGIFSILGVVASVAGAAMPVSFAVGGVVALFAAYSYVMLGKRFPSVGGAVTFLVRGFGDGPVAGTLNIFQYLAYVIAIALYAHGFAAYAQTFIALPGQVWAVGVVVVFTAVNFIGSRVMGRAESVIVIIKVAILVVFIVAAALALTPAGEQQLAPSNWSDTMALLTGAGLIFVGYEGFGLITNASGNMRRPSWELPRAIYLAIAIVIVIYLCVAAGVVSNVPFDELRNLGDAALAVAAEPALGNVGFTLVAVAALLSTASAVNATLFGAANISYQISKNGDLPTPFSRELWGRDVEGLFITAGLVLVFVLLFPLSAVASMGSAGFLLVYSAVGVGHLRIRSETGARRWPIIVSVVLCMTLFVILFAEMVRVAPTSAIALAVALLLSWLTDVGYRRFRNRRLAGLLDHH